MDKTKKKVLLITSRQPSLNPRLVKEADTLTGAGYEVKVVYAYWNTWATTFDKLLLSRKKWETIRVGGDPKQEPFAYFFSRVLFKLSINAAKRIGLKYFAEAAISRTSRQQLKEALKFKADLYIAHNLGALPVTVKAAKYYRKPCGFDAEDFHRHEASNDIHNFDVRLKTYIEDKYIPQTDYLTTSSPQITKSYQRLFPDKSLVTLLNVFEKSPDIPVNAVNHDQPLKLFWFSQTIGSDRGIEGLIKALNCLDGNHFELHLLGSLKFNLNKAYFDSLVNSKLYTLIFHDPIPSEELIKFTSQFDIGLALEPAFSINNDIALSNKLFTYMQAGLAIIASSTTAQTQFLKTYPEIGKLYEINSILSLSEILLHYSQNRDELYKARQASLNLAQTTLNWETEKIKFLKIVEQTLNAQS